MEVKSNQQRQSEFSNKVGIYKQFQISEEVEDIEDIIDDPVKFHQKLLQNGILDSEYLEFLNELDETANNEAQNIEHVEKYFTAEIDKLKAYYETQIHEIREESTQIITTLQSENEELQEKLEKLSLKLKEQAELPPKPTNPKSSNTNTMFSRRNSENGQLVKNRLDLSKNRYKNEPKSSLNSSTSHKDPQALEDDNLRLKKQLDDQVEKSDRLRIKWDNKFEEQKKTIQELKKECDSLKQQLSQQNSKHLKESNKNKDLIKKMERDMKSLKRSVDDVTKEKSQLRDKLKRQIDSETRSNGETRIKKRVDLSKDVCRSQNDLDFQSNRMS